MSGPTPSAVLGLLRSQLFIHPHKVTSSFADQTIIVTGGNAGLGKATVQLLVELGAASVVIACRTTSKGEVAKNAIETATGRRGVIQVWQLDLADNASILAFAQRMEALSRLDAVIANAGIWPTKHEVIQGHELALLTNVISTALLAQLCLPKLLASAKAFNTTSRLTFVGSQLHKFATLTSRKGSGSLIAALDSQTLKAQADYDARYNDSKLLLQMYGQRLAKEHAQRYGDAVCITVVNPGYCLSGLKRPTDLGTRMFEKMLARTTEEGAYALVDAVALDKIDGRNGRYIDDLSIKMPAAWLATKDGKQTDDRLWKEVNGMLGQIAGEPELAVS